VADSVGVPQGSFWFAAWVLISVAVGFFLYIASKGKMMVGTMVMAALLVLGWQMELVPGYVPFIGGLLVAFSFISHKEVYKG